MKHNGYDEQAPKAYADLLNVQIGLATTGVVASPVKNLLSLYMAQKLGCAFCADLHTGYAGNTPKNKLTCLTAFREAGAMYSEEEFTALRLGEAILQYTREGEIRDQETLDEVVRVFSPAGLAELMFTATMSITWAISNRIFEVGPGELKL